MWLAWSHLNAKKIIFKLRVSDVMAGVTFCNASDLLYKHNPDCLQYTDFASIYRIVCLLLCKTKLLHARLTVYKESVSSQVVSQLSLIHI